MGYGVVFRVLAGFRMSGLRVASGLRLKIESLLEGAGDLVSRL